MITLEDVKANKAVSVYIERADYALKQLGFTEHSFAHVVKVSTTAGQILKELDYTQREIELAKIAGYMHDIGNIVNRIEHSQSGAVMAFRILDKMDMAPEDIATVVSAIGNHDEGTGVPVDAVSAALILADKSDVRRSRVRNEDITSFDIHDRVNYSALGGGLSIEKEEKNIRLSLNIDSKYSSIMDYFEIFLERMVLCRKAAEKLGMNFKLTINGQNLL